MSSEKYLVGSVDDSLEEYLSLAGEGLLSNDRDGWQLYVDRIGLDNIRVVRCDNRVAGGMAFYRMGQWFGGKPVPCAGISGVAISPVDRGTGACHQMLRSVLREVREEGISISSLFASAQHVYRRLGFDHAGVYTQYSIPITAIACSDRTLPIHRFLTPPLEPLRRVAEAMASVNNGHLQRTDGLWQRLLNPYDGDGTITYIIGELDDPQGYAIFRPGKRDGGVPQPLISTDVAANTPSALRRLLTLVHDHRSMCDQFEWFGAPNDMIPFFASEQFVDIKFIMRWFLRILDVPAALAARGYDESLDGELHLEVHDDLIEENNGQWIMRLQNGSVEVVRGGSGALRLNVRELASMYSSYYSAQQLRQFGGLETANVRQLEFADRVFAGPSPWVPELY